MIGPRSLKAQFLLGSILWTVGLLGASHLLFVYVTRHAPRVLAVQHWAVLAVLAGAFMLGGLTQVRRGLRPVNQLRQRLAAVRDGRASALGGEYPGEVQPLVDDLNALLEHREQSVRRAREEAADFAHVLKTPLAVLAQDVAELERAGHVDLAANMRHELHRMQRHVDYHLAHTRAAASAAVPGTRCAVRDSVEPLVRAMRRLHAGRDLMIEMDLADPEVAVMAERHDLDEMLGNLLDNACTWARSRVRVSATVERTMVVILVDDDGPGVGAAARDAVMNRGVRADESKPGSGLGLAITQALARRYGGRVSLEGSLPEGGTHAALYLPGAAI